MRPTAHHPDAVPALAHVLGRRSALLLGGATGLAAVVGCTVQNPYADHSTAAGDALPDLAPDVAVAVEAVGLLLTAQDRASATAAAFPGLRERVEPLVTVHEAHTAALRAAVPDGVDARPTAAPAVVPRTRAKALARLSQGEQDLHDGLTGLALRAQSGPFARLLGSMAAATSQQLAVLDR